MTTPRNLSILADAVNTSGVLGVSGGMALNFMTTLLPIKRRTTQAV